MGPGPEQSRSILNRLWRNFRDLPGPWCRGLNSWGSHGPRLFVENQPLVPEAGALDQTGDIRTIVHMNIVSDTNVFLAVVLNEPEKRRIIQITSGSNVVAPEILPYEIGNALSAMHKRRQITNKEALFAQRATNNIPVRLVAIDIQKALRLAMEFKIYAYDAYFLQCAKSLSSPLITLDNRMKQVAAKLNIDVLE